jgi:Ca-activated chloride channel family protein
VHAAPYQTSFLGYAARLAEPRALWLLAVPMALAVLGGVAILRRRGELRRATGTCGERVALGAGVARPAARLALQTLGLGLLAVALAQPQCGARTELSKRYGVDLVVALDASRSMLARDVKPDRLARAKLELTTLLDRLSGDRVGIVVFAEQAFVQCPLTTDYAAAKLFLKAVGPDSIPQQGTSLESALSAAREVLEAGERGARSKVVLLLTDGEDNEPGALDAADELAAQGIRVFAVGIGSSAGEPIPLVDKQGTVIGYKKDRQGSTVLTRLEEGLLRSIAERTSGRYFHTAGAALELGEVRAELDRLEKSEIEGRLTVTFEDQYAIAAYPGFLLLLGGLVLREGRPDSGSRRKGEGAA